MKLDKFLELLDDGEWHDLSEIEEKMKLTSFKTKLLVHLFVNHDFCEITTGGKMVKMRPEMLHFFKALEEAEML